MNVNDRFGKPNQFQFGGKAGLLNALVIYEGNKQRKPLEDLDVSSAPLEEGLALIAKAYTTVIYDNHAIEIIVSSSRKARSFRHSRLRLPKMA